MPFTESGAVFYMTDQAFSVTIILTEKGKETIEDKRENHHRVRGYYPQRRGRRPDRQYDRICGRRRAGRHSGN